MTITINGTSGITSVDGSTSVPSYTGTDTDTGLYFPAANQLSLVTGAATALTVDSTQKVGIGTTSPDALLIVNTVASFGAGSASAPSVAAKGNLNTGMWFPAANTVAFSTAGSECMRISSGGNVGIGMTPYSSIKLNVQGGSGTSTEFAAFFAKNNSDYSTNNYYIAFNNNAGGGNGAIVGNGAGAATFGGYSDRNLKENIVELEPQLKNICALKPVSFNYKESFAEGSPQQIGFIAQDMQEIYPDAVGSGPSGMLTIAGWSKTEARLVKAIQELKSELDALKAEVAALKGV